MVAIVPSDPDNTLHPSAALLLTRDCFSPSGAGCTTSFFEPMHPNVMQHPERGRGKREGQTETEERKREREKHREQETREDREGERETGRERESAM